MTMGRPSDFSQELAEQICELIISGKSLLQICTLEEYPDKSTVFRWLAKNPEFRDSYARAKELSAEHMAEELLEIADDTSADVYEHMPNNVAVQRDKLRSDTRKWLMAKLAPKKYGDKVQHTGGDGEGPVQFVVTRAGTKEK